MAEQKAGVSRRDFLTCSGIAALGALGAASLSGCAPKNSESKANGGENLSNVEWQGEFDVIVIGFGDAGASAAITAADAGAKVLLVDKAGEHAEGGNSRYCEQYICMWDNEEDGYDFIKAMSRGFNDSTEEIMRYMAKGAYENKAWLESLGGNIGQFQMMIGKPEEAAIKGFGKQRYEEMEASHWVAKHEDGTIDISEYEIWPNGELNNGRQYWAQLNYPDENEKKLWKFLRSQVAQRSDNITVWFNAPAIALIQDPGTNVVAGATIDHNGKTVNVHARNGVILSCGSYEGSTEAFQTYAHRADHFPIGSIYNTGDGITLGSSVGAKLWHMSAISGPWLNPKVPDVDRCYWLGGVFQRFTDKGNCITVGSDARRFMAESGSHKHGHIYLGGSWQPQIVPETMWAVFDATAREGEKLCDMIDESLIIEAETLEELAQKTELDGTVLAKTVESYNGFCAQGRDDEFNRLPSSLAPIETPPFFAVRLHGACVNAQGGPKRNTDCQVLDVDEKPIPHLYSAGELGSFWAGTYIGGGNIAECLYSGRTAGTNAATEKSDGPSIEVKVENAPNELIEAGDPADGVECGPDEYAGSYEGIHAPIVVKVKVSDGKMTEIDIVDQKETGAVVHDLFEIMPAAMLEANSVEVDGVTGATCTSNALRKAVQAALDKAQ